MLRRKKNSKDKRIVSEILLVIIISIIVLTGVVIYAVYRLRSGYKDYETASEVYESAQKQYVLINRPGEATESENVMIPLQYTEQDDYLSQDDNEGFRWYDIVDINFSDLGNVNSEVCGWIYFENEDISYPLMYSGDNTKYLDHDYTGAALRSGAIFVDGTNNNDFSDAHTLIYGHNMIDSSMFGKLNYYKTDEDYYEGHKYFQIITPTKKLRCEIVSYKDVPADGYIYKTYKRYDSGFTSFALNYVFKNSYIQPNVSITNDDRIITLSTCSGSDNIRFVVSAVVVDEY
ncbi:MAG: class B sortase [Lachnospiraceae bacterium]|nr:class B sortase [Lachnospiraceae bacterium]